MKRVCPSTESQEEDKKPHKELGKRLDKNQEKQ